MPRVSRIQLSKPQLSDILQHFTYLLTSLKNSKDIDNFFYEFLTEEEKIMLAKRLVLYMMLEKKYEVEDIKILLHLSYETIRSYKHAFIAKSPDFKKTIQSIIHHEKTKNFFKKIEKTLDIISTIASSKTNMKSRAKILSGGW